MFTADEVKEIEKMLESGMTKKAIAEKFGCSDATIGRISRGEFEPIKKIICPFCEGEYFPKQNRLQATCGSEACLKQRENNYRKALRSKKHKKMRGECRPNPIREYTDTSNMMIVVDLEKGYSLEYIAKAYDRDKNDLEKHIEKIKADGTVEKIKKKLEKYRENQRMAIWGG